jgi:hypothetical protein
MRHIRRLLIVVICTQLSSFTLAPPIQAASPTSLTAHASQSVIGPSGATIALTGRLLVSSASSPGARRLSVQQRMPGTTTWRPHVRITTNRHGRYTLPIQLTQPAELRVLYSGDKRRTPATSPIVRVVQRPKVVAELRFPHPGQLNDIGTLRGSVEPNMSDRQLLIQRKDRGLWRSVDTVDVDRDGTFRALVSPGRVGWSVYRVKLPPSGAYLAAYSADLPILVADPLDDFYARERQLAIAYCEALGDQIRFLTSLGGAARPALVFVGKLMGDMSVVGCINDPRAISDMFHNFGKYLGEYFIDLGVDAIARGSWERIIDDILAKLRVDLEPFLEYLKNLFNNWLMDAVEALLNAMNACFASHPFPAWECSLWPQIRALQAHLLR